MKNLYILLLLLSVILISCKSTQISNIPKENPQSLENNDTAVKNLTKSQIISDTTFVNLKDYSKDFVYDMRYATKKNFLNEQVYNCAECFLRLKTVNALILANKKFLKMGFKIKLYDCYRPLDIQKKMWQIVSNPLYVANPAKGSIHNKGAAVDITLVDLSGKELDMGTDFDFFGEAASHNYKKLSKTVLKNRIKLKTIMIATRFKSFDSEWWHYNLADGLDDKISNEKWNCN